LRDGREDALRAGLVAQERHLGGGDGEVRAASVRLVEQRADRVQAGRGRAGLPGRAPRRAHDTGGDIISIDAPVHADDARGVGGGGLQREVAQDDGGAGRAGVRRVLEVGRAGGGARDVHGDGRAAGDEERLRRLRGAPRVVLKGDGEGVRAGGDAGRVPADGEGL